MSPTTTTPARPDPRSTLTAQATSAAQATEPPERRAHPLVAVGLGLVAGLLLARWIRR